MPFIFDCPHCESPMTVPDHLAGTAAACASCGQAITLPTAPAAPPGPTPPGLAAAPQPATATPPPERRRARGTALAMVVLVLAVVGLVASGVALVRWGASRRAAATLSTASQAEPAPVSGGSPAAPTTAGSRGGDTAAGAGTYPFTIAASSAEPIRTDSSGEPISGPRELLYERHPGCAIGRVKQQLRVTIATEGRDTTLVVSDSGEDITGERGEIDNSAYYALKIVTAMHGLGLVSVGPPFSGKGTVEVELVTEEDGAGAEPTVVSNALSIPLVIGEAAGEATGASTAGPSSQPGAGTHQPSDYLPGASVSFRAKALGLISVAPNDVSGPYHYWLLERLDSVRAGGVRYWVVDCENSSQSAGLKGKKLGELALRGAVELRVEMDRSKSMRRFLSPFLPDSLVDVIGTRSGEGQDEIETLRCPLPSSLPAGWQENDVNEFGEDARLAEMPVLVRAKLTEPPA